MLHQSENLLKITDVLQTCAHSHSTKPFSTSSIEVSFFLELDSLPFTDLSCDFGLELKQHQQIYEPALEILETNLLSSSSGWTKTYFLFYKW